MSEAAKNTAAWKRGLERYNEEADRVRELEDACQRDHEHFEREVALEAMVRAMARAKVAEDRVRALEEALKPFAMFGSLRGIESLPDEHILTQGSRMAAKQCTVADFRRAARTLADAKCSEIAGQPQRTLGEADD